ncbi:MAG TPA: nucleotidyltransferase [Thermoleophilaceae bacterium]|nr:nucleotidyltransferase [Thermoleophilaceae bacterium]
MAGAISFDELTASMKRAAAALLQADVEFALAGSLATWARGGPKSSHDLDFVLRERDGERALAALEAIGMRREDPPEEWLVKAWDENDVLVDLIFGPSGVDADEVLAGAEVLNVLSMEIPVMRLEDVIVTKVMSLTEHSIDYGTLLEMARALREQIDWAEVRRRTAQSPFADAYFVILDRLEIVPAPGPGDDGGDASRVRVEVTRSGEGRM